MYNDSSNNENEEEYTMSKRLFVLAIMTASLGLLRLASLDFMMMLSDLLTALMIYFYACSRTKCMAIFCMINGVIGIIYAIMRISPSIAVSKGNWFNFYYFLLTLIAFYAFLVYAAICYYALVGILKYPMNFGLPAYPQQENGVSTNYGAISADTNNGFKAFSGKGTALGSAV